MDVNDNACCLDERVARAFIASKLAPTDLLPGHVGNIRFSHRLWLLVFNEG